jgi:hypothetical protein
VERRGAATDSLRGHEWLARCFCQCFVNRALDFFQAKWLAQKGAGPGHQRIDPLFGFVIGRHGHHWNLIQLADLLAQAIAIAVWQGDVQQNQVKGGVLQAVERFPATSCR